MVYVDVVMAIYVEEEARLVDCRSPFQEIDCDFYLYHHNLLCNPYLAVDLCHRTVEVEVLVYSHRPLVEENGEREYDLDRVPADVLDEGEESVLDPARISL